MLVRNAQGNLEDQAPAKQGQESDAAAEARELLKQVRRVRNTSDDPEKRQLADALIALAAYVYQGR